MDKPVGTSGPFTERPIIFNGEMVRAILEGRKTQTRRLLTPQPPDHLSETDPLVSSSFAVATWDNYSDGSHYECACSFGVPGDRLWVRETWFCPSPDYEDGQLVYYRASGDKLIGAEDKWSPSIHMPRWASRIDLEITDIRVERLQDISENDAKAEGTSPDPKQWDACYTDAFIRLWNSIYEKRGFGWDTNPWVWVIEFRRLGG